MVGEPGGEGKRESRKGGSLVTILRNMVIEARVAALRDLTTGSPFVPRVAAMEKPWRLRMVQLSLLCKDQQLLEFCLSAVVLC